MAGCHYPEMERVPQSDVNDLNLGLYSVLLLYIRVKCAPLPRAQQDVAEDEE